MPRPVLRAMLSAKGGVFLKKSFIFFLLITMCFSVCCSAHSGKTDSSGGHYNRSTGEYHYHHGYPAHQHTNGSCPYNFDDQTGSRSGSSASSSVPFERISPKEETPEPDEHPSLFQIVVKFAAVCFLCFPFSYPIFYAIISGIASVFKKVKKKR